MSLKSTLAIPFAKKARKKVYKWAYNPHKTQQKIFKELIKKTKNNTLGKDHNFDKITSYSELKKQIKVTDYEGIRSYEDRIIAGEKNVLWKGKQL